MKPTGTRLAIREAYRYSGLGCTFAAAVLLFMAGGWLLDGWLRVTPLFSVIGALIGAVLGSVSIYRRLLTGPEDGENGGRT
jgi:F0F1-type ATP synthase assembly protein I